MDEIDFMDGEYYMLSAFSAHQVEIWGAVFPTAEHAFHWKKFEDVLPDVAMDILQASSPTAAKCIAKKQKPRRRDDWAAVKVGFMEDISRAKCLQHDDVREALGRSRNIDLVEKAPHDYFWGTGADGSGENQIGKIWMRIRLEL